MVSKIKIKIFEYKGSSGVTTVDYADNVIFEHIFGSTVVTKEKYDKNYLLLEIHGFVAEEILEKET